MVPPGSMPRLDRLVPVESMTVPVPVAGPVELAGWDEPELPEDDVELLLVLEDEPDALELLCNTF